MQVLGGSLPRGTYNLMLGAIQGLLGSAVINASTVERIERLGEGRTATTSGAVRGLAGGFAVGAMFAPALIPATVFAGGAIGNRKRAGVTIAILFRDGSRLVAAVTVDEFQKLQAWANSGLVPDSDGGTGPTTVAALDPGGPAPRVHQLLHTSTIQIEGKNRKLQIFDDAVHWEAPGASRREAKTWKIPLTEIASAELREDGARGSVVIKAYDAEYMFSMQSHAAKVAVQTMSRLLEELEEQREQLAAAPVDEASSAPPPDVLSVADQIKELHELRELGAIDDGEFSAAKAQLLGRI